MIIFILSFLLLFSCDFTPPLRKDILRAQEHIKEQNYIKAVKVYKDIKTGSKTKTEIIQLNVKVTLQVPQICSEVLYLSSFM